MKIDDKIQELKTELIKALTEYSGSREDVTQMLEKVGLDKEIISSIIEAFMQAEKAKNTVKNIWGSDTKIDSSTDVATYQQQESETRQKFDDIIEASSILIILNRTNIKDVNEELWQKLYAQGIDASQITRPVLSKNYKEYVEKIERENNPDTLKLKGILSRVLKQAARLKKRCGELEEENEDLKAENERLKRENESLRSSYNYMENKFNTRIVSDEKYYQSALEQIKTQKREIRNLQNRGIFQTIGAKLFGNRQKALPEPTVVMPTTLYESIVEEIQAKGHDKIEAEPDKQIQKSERTNDDNELEI